MSNVSGIEDNKVFRSNSIRGSEYYYIESQVKLDTSIPNTSTYGYYSKTSDERYVIIDDASIIAEVTTYVSSDFESGNLSFLVGGSSYPSGLVLPLVEPWGGPTGNVPGALTAGQLKTSQVCRYGRENESPDKKCLSVSITNTSGLEQNVQGTLYIVIKVYPKFQ